MSDLNTDAPKVKMLPPTLVLQHIALGLMFNWIINLFIPLSFGHGIGWFGLFLMGAAYGTAWRAKTLFERAGTNIPPNKPALTIVKDGPYRYTRNPMYLSFLMGFVGMALMANAPVMLIFAFPLFYVLDQWVIVPEETYLSQKFGQDYIDYKNSVRRWI